MAIDGRYYKSQNVKKGPYPEYLKSLLNATKLWATLSNNATSYLIGDSFTAISCFKHVSVLIQKKIKSSTNCLIRKIPGKVFFKVTHHNKIIPNSAQCAKGHP